MQLVTCATLATSALSLLLCQSALAQIVPDTTLPIPPAVNQAGDIYTINGGTPSVLNGAGERNLFHSFLEFSPPTGSVVTFNSGATVRNIIVRVTGPSASNIDGTIAANANFFLFNPNGVVFGPNADLNINGSFLASTASSVTFPNGSEFGVTTTTDPILSIDLPVSLNFGPSAGAIQINGAELGLPEHTLGLVGAGITMTDGVVVLPTGTAVVQASSTSAINGRSEIGSVAPGSRIAINPLGQDFALDYRPVTGYRDITLSNASEIRTPGGDAQIRGRNITLTGGSSISSLPSTGLILGGPDLPGGTVDIFASGTLRLSGVQTFTIPSVGSLEFPTGIYTQNDGSGLDAGNVNIAAGNVVVQNGAVIDSSTQGAGASGNIAVTATGQVYVGGESPLGQRRSRISAFSTNFASSPAGNVELTAQRITLRDHGSISVNSASPLGAGNITLTSQVVELYNRSRISATTQNLTGGNITFRNQALIFMGPCEQGSCPTGNNAITASALGTASGGNIDIILRSEGGILTSPWPLNNNNDVIASAISGTGGRINIQNLIGLDPRRRNPITGEPDPLNFVQFSGTPSPDSDLIASSAFGINGTVELNFRQDLESDELPSEFLGNDLEQSCTTGGRGTPERERNQSTFNITGNGGLAPDLNAPLGGSGIRVPLAPLPSSNGDTSTRATDHLAPPAPARISRSNTPC
jgi:filamentous hemagglutinin family protein